MSEINLNQVNSWFNEARVILEKANQLLGGSNLVFNKLITEINEILAINRYQFMIDAVSQQLRLLDLIQSSLVQLVDAFNTELSQEVRENSVAHLDDVLASLRHVDTTNGKTLYDFINHEDLAATKARYTGLLDRLNSGKGELSTGEITAKLADLQAEFSTLIDTNSLELITTSLDDTIAENIELQQDMAGLLDSLTKHYDQAGKSVEYLQDGSVAAGPKLELYNVLKNDSLELPTVVDELEDVNRAFLKNNDKIAHNLATFHLEETALVQFFAGIQEYGVWLQSDFISGFNTVYNRLVDDFDEFYVQNDNLVALSKYYRKFVESFDRLAQELKRRQNVNVKLAKMVQEFEARTQEIIAADTRARESFLLENGEYLPKNILDEDSDSSNILYNALPELTISFRAEHVPQI